VSPDYQSNMAKVPDPKVEHGYRAQVAAIPVRRAANGLEVLLISSRETRRWIIPKGWPMKGRKDHQAAAREALEEAGVSGKVHKLPIGAYTYQKRLAVGVQPCRVMVYVLEVDKERSNWREKDQRRREWLSPETAAEQIQEPGLARLIRGLAQKQDVA
jgi:8-oxo-dGTP pyrophosphatase MutT (NUDIX family)